MFGQLPQHGLGERPSLAGEADQRVGFHVPDDFHQVFHVGGAVGASEGDLVRRQDVASRAGDQAFGVDHEDRGAGLLDGDLSFRVVRDGRGDGVRDADGGGARAIEDDASFGGGGALGPDAVEETRADDGARALDVVVEAELAICLDGRGGGQEERGKEKKGGRERGGEKKKRMRVREIESSGGKKK